MRVLFDKLGLHHANDGNVCYYDMYGRYRDETDSLYNVIFALLMYDDVHYLANSLSNAHIFFRELPITPITVDEEYLWNICKFVRENINPPVAYPGPKTCTLFNFFGPIEYMFIANYLGCTYMPALSRAQYLNEHYNFEKHTINLPKEIMNFIDREIIDFYSELNAKIGKSYINFSFPLLVEYLYSISSNENILDTALKLRNQKETVAFRKWLNTIDDAINNGNWVEYNNCLNIIGDIIKDIKKIDKHLNKDMEISISWTPSLSFPFKINHDLKKQRRTGCVFVRNLANYALRERSARPEYLRYLY